MRIASSNIAMASEHWQEESTVEQESLRIWGEKGKVSAALAAAEDVKAGYVIDISAEARLLYAQTTEATETKGLESLFQLSDNDDPKLRLIQAMVEALTGKRFKFVLPVQYQTADMGFSAGQIKLTIRPLQAQPLAGWGVDYSSFKRHTERESVSFSAAGIVTTADGKRIDISMAMNMSREFITSESISFKAGDALRDPLVINFAAPAAKLTQTKYSFDIDADGKADQISFTGPGSGFLALDLNNDGKINNGSELFGPESGNGFADLAKYDSDGNNWIDENDDIYDKLRIWTKDENGQDQLLALGQKGVGAIYLGNVSTEFALKDPANNQQGQVRSTGIFLREDGSAGTIQHVDLVV